MQQLDTAQLAAFLRVSKRTIQRKAISGKWPYTEQIGLGGTRRLYHYTALPQRIKNKIVADIIAKHERCAIAQGGELVDTSDARPPLSEPASFKALCLSTPEDPQSIDKTHLKFGVLALARQHVSEGQLRKIMGFDQFCQLYNSRVLVIAPFVYDTIKSVSRITLLRWETKEAQWCTAVEPQPDSIFEATLKTVVQEVRLLVPEITAQRLRLHLTTLFFQQPIPGEKWLAQWMNE